jgi:hypothetical protein
MVLLNSESRTSLNQIAQITQTLSACMTIQPIRTPSFSYSRQVDSSVASFNIHSPESSRLIADQRAASDPAINPSSIQCSKPIVPSSQRDTQPRAPSSDIITPSVALSNSSSVIDLFNLSNPSALPFTLEQSKAVCLQTKVHLIRRSQLRIIT